jgi:hypothetical protein
MARRDTGKWVARAAATGGSRAYRGQAPVRWYGSLALITLVGLASIVYSRYELEHPSTAGQPTVGTHWYAGLAFDVCGDVQPNLPANPNKVTPGIYTEGDGVIRIAPTTSADAGANATLGRFVSQYPGLTLSTDTLQLPGKARHVDGQRCPSGSRESGRQGVVQVKVWPSFVSQNGSIYGGDPTTVKLANGQLITVAFVPAGASIPKPSSATVATLTPLAAGTNSTTTTAPVSIPTSTTSPTATVPGPTTTTPSGGTPSK